MISPRWLSSRIPSHLREIDEAAEGCEAGILPSQSVLVVPVAARGPCSLISGCFLYLLDLSAYILVIIIVIHPGVTYLFLLEMMAPACTLLRWVTVASSFLSDTFSCSRLAASVLSSLLTMLHSVTFACSFAIPSDTPMFD